MIIGLIIILSYRLSPQKFEVFGETLFAVISFGYPLIGSFLLCFGIISLITKKDYINNDINYNFVFYIVAPIIWIEIKSVVEEITDVVERGKIKSFALTIFNYLLQYNL